MTVTDVAGEAPGVPAAPMVSAASATSVTAAWTAPANAGPPITDYDYRYRVTAPQGPWTEVTTTAITGLSVTITGLAEDTEYEVQVRATTDEGTSGWSASGSGSTNANNTPATGQPTISGVAQVGSLLTAGKGTIADVNGTTKADNGDSGYAYTYQWIRVDGGTETNISDATSSTYTPVDVARALCCLWSAAVTGRLFPGVTRAPVSVVLAALSPMRRADWSRSCPCSLPVWSVRSSSRSLVSVDACCSLRSIGSCT